VGVAFIRLCGFGRQDEFIFDVIFRVEKSMSRGAPGSSGPMNRDEERENRSQETEGRRKTKTKAGKVKIKMDLSVVGCMSYVASCARRKRRKIKS
jgi:hypothetical protein